MHFNVSYKRGTCILSHFLLLFLGKGVLVWIALYLQADPSKKKNKKNSFSLLCLTLKNEPLLHNLVKILMFIFFTPSQFASLFTVFILLFQHFLFFRGRVSPPLMHLFYVRTFTITFATGSSTKIFIKKKGSGRDEMEEMEEIRPLIEQRTGGTTSFGSGSPFNHGVLPLVGTPECSCHFP